MIITNFLVWVIGLLMVYTVFLIANDNRTKHETLTPLVQVIVWTWIILGVGEILYLAAQRLWVLI